MRINKEVINRLLKLLDQGLTIGAGHFRKDGDFCVQQAVSKALGEIEPVSYPVSCVSPFVRQFGITLNDREWRSPEARAKGMKRFAVAELGSDKIDSGEFDRRLRNKWEKLTGIRRESLMEIVGSTSRLSELANMAALVLIELGTEGSQYMYMCDPGAELKPEHKKKLDQAKALMTAAQLQWRNYGAQGTENRTASHLS